MRNYLNFLLVRGFYELAYYTWLQFLPSDRLGSMGLLFNGTFETQASGLPFDWTISAGRGATAELLPIPDGGGRQGLRIAFTEGRVQFGGVEQAVLIPQGRYVLSGRLRGGIEGKRGLRWRVNCLGNPVRLLAESPMHLGPVAEWERFELEFEIPADCLMQQVRLDHDARSPSEQLARGTLWYADMAIRRRQE